MQIAALLSDLNSLSVSCPHAAAMALVNVHKITPNVDSSSTNVDPSTSPDSSHSTSQPSINAAPISGSADDVDLKRANELVSLHYDVKVKHLESGLDGELRHARRVVEGVLKSLG